MIPRAMLLPDALPAPLRAAIAGYRWTAVTDGMSDCGVLRGEAKGRPTCYLKYGRDSAADELSAEHARLAWLTDRIAAAKPLQFCRDRNVAYLLTSSVDGRPALDCLRNEPARRAQIVATLAGFLRSLHALPIPECPFNAGHEQRLVEARCNIDAGRVNSAMFDLEHAGCSAAQVWAAMLELLPLQFEQVVTHGDFTLDNVLLQDGQVSGCIDVGRAGIADPYQDLALLWRELEPFGHDLQRHLFAAYGIPDMDPARLRFHLDLDEFF